MNEITKPENPAISDPDLGQLIRSFGADFNHTIGFYIGAGVVCLLGLGAIILRLSISPEPGPGAPGGAAAERLGAIIFGFVILPVGLFFASAGFWNSKNRLELFERGLRIRSPRGLKQISYADIKDVAVNEKSFSIMLTPKLPAGDVKIKRLLIQLHDGDTVLARCVESPKTACREIMLKLRQSNPYLP